MRYADVGDPEEVLAKVSRKATRMFKRKTFRKPVDRELFYRAPAKKAPWASACIYCKRPTAYGSTRCRECFQKLVRAKYAEKVRKEVERLRLVNEAFKTVNKRKEIAMKKAKDLPVSPITRSTSGLRSALFEEMEALRSGASNAQRARSVAMMANSILQSVQVEIEYHKYVRDNKGRIEGDQKAVTLGTDISLTA